MKPPSWRIDEAPLVAFTAAAIAGAGVAVSRPLAWMMGLPASAPGRDAAIAVLLLVGGGLLTSVLHLGRPGRMTKAIRRTGKNALSNEVVLASVTVGAALILAALPVSELWIQPLWVFLSLAAFGLLVSLEAVYSIPAQLAWSGIPALTPLPLALLFGSTSYAPAAIAGSDAVIRFIIGLVVVDAVLWILRCRRVEKARRLGTAVHAEIMAARGWLAGVRFALITLLFPVAVIFGSWVSALVLLGLGLLLDRFAFYGLAVRQTAESEIARVETVINMIS
jgi:DMSO reductase anchor subunit